MQHCNYNYQKTALFVGAHAEYMFRFRLPIMKRLQHAGYRIVVLATPSTKFDIQNFDCADIEFVPWTLKPAGLNPFEDITHIYALWRVLSALQPDILFVHTIKSVIYALPLARLAGIKRRVCMIPGLGFAFIKGTGLSRRITRIFATICYRFALHWADLAIFQNADDRATLQQSGAIPSPTQTALVNGSGVDMNKFPPAPVPDGPPVFLMVSRLLRDKGVLEYVAAASHVKKIRPDIRFVLVGGSDHNHASIADEDIATWVSDGYVELLGHISDPFVEFAKCHVFVLPSYREGTPRTNLEAMAVGRAIITTDAPGCRSTVEHGLNGLLVPVADVDALADAMLELADDPVRVRQMGAAGRARCARLYELSIVADATTALILGDVAEGQGAPNPVKRR